MARVYNFPVPFLLEGLPDLLRTLRERCGFTQAQVAEALRFAPSSMSHFENGKAISLDKLVRLLTHYGVGDFAELQRELNHLAGRAVDTTEETRPPQVKTAEDMLTNARGLEPSR